MFTSIHVSYVIVITSSVSTHAQSTGVGKNDCVNTKHERVIVNTKRKQVIMRGKLLQFKVIQINLLSSGGSWIID